VPENASGNVRSVRAWSNTVGAGYFSTMGVALIRGREFTLTDNERAPNVVIVNQARLANTGAIKIKWAGGCASAMDATRDRARSRRSPES